MITEEFQKLFSLLEQAEEQSKKIERMIENQSPEHKEFSKLFIREDMAKNVENCTSTVAKVTRDLHQAADSELKKLPLESEFAELKKQREQLLAPSLHLTMLLKKAGARNADALIDKLQQNGITQNIDSYRQKVQELSKYAIDKDAFQKAFALQKKTNFPGSEALEKWDTIKFGTYPQTRNGSDRTPIEWIVLDILPGKVLLISKYGLDAQPYNTKYTDVTWETCTLRRWLNNDFLNKAFTAEEKKAIVITTVNNSLSQCYSGYVTEGGNNTQDKIFLLSYAETNKYFNVKHYLIAGTTDNKKSRVEPTAYALAQGAYTNSYDKTQDGASSGWWWLRSPGDFQFRAAYVGYDGSLRYDYVIVDSAVVRPALCLNLESGIF